MNRVDLGRDFIEHREFNTKERAKLAGRGQAMPTGGFPIMNRQDLKNAIQSIGRAKNYDSAKAHIIKRAKALGLTELLPEGWVEEAEHMDALDDVLEHHGIRGMKWGVRRSRKQIETRAGKSVKDMSDDELRSVVNRLNMEQQYSRLTSGSNSSRNRKLIAAGAGFVGSIALNIARTQLQNQANAAVGSRITKLASKKGR